MGAYLGDDVLGLNLAKVKPLQGTVALLNLSKVPAVVAQGSQQVPL